MKKTLTLAIAVLLACTFAAHAQQPDWCSAIITGCTNPCLTSWSGTPTEDFYSYDCYQVSGFDCGGNYPSGHSGPPGQGNSTVLVGYKTTHCGAGNTTAAAFFQQTQSCSNVAQIDMTASYYPGPTYWYMTSIGEQLKYPGGAPQETWTEVSDCTCYPDLGGIEWAHTGPNCNP